MQIYKIYYYNQSIFITKKSIFKKYNSDYKIINVANKNTIKVFVESQLFRVAPINYILICNNPKSVFKNFKKQFNLVVAGGGIVKNKSDEILFIFRKGVWDLPKGKIELNESVKKGALREIIEETGVVDIKLKNRNSIVHHVYLENGIKYFKTTYWFNVKCYSDKGLSPQIEEGIEDVKWIKRKDFDYFLAKSYISIKNLLLSQSKNKIFLFT